jgi:Trp operon repressor
MSNEKKRLFEPTTEAIEQAIQKISSKYIIESDANDAIGFIDDAFYVAESTIKKLSDFVSNLTDGEYITIMELTKRITAASQLLAICELIKSTSERENNEQNKRVNLTSREVKASSFNAYNSKEKTILSISSDESETLRERVQVLEGLIQEMKCPIVKHWPNPPE